MPAIVDDEIGAGEDLDAPMVLTGEAHGFLPGLRVDPKDCQRGHSSRSLDRNPAGRSLGHLEL